METHHAGPEFGWRPWPRSLRGKIGAGFLLVLVLHSIVAVLSHVGLDLAEATYKQSRRQQAELTDVLQVSREVVVLQRGVYEFMSTGDGSIADDVRRRAADLDTHLVALRDGLKADVPRSETEKLIESIQAYRMGFESVVEDRDRREKVLRERVRPYAVQFQETLTQVIEQAGPSRTKDDPSPLAARALLDLSAAEECVQTYLLAPHGSQIREFRAGIEASERSLRELIALDLPSPLDQRVRGLELQLREWERAVLDVVHSTRSYLHLVNVVLAGQALEFRTLSTRLAQRSLESQLHLEQRLTASQERFKTWALCIGITTLLVGCMVGRGIRRAVSSPIDSMTETFSALARGEAASVQGVERQDEIGEMARAAEVFAARNNETRELLARTRELSSKQEATNAELQANLRELERRNEDLDSFSYSASHDLRSPLNSIAHLASWILEDAGEHLPEESRDHLHTLIGRTHRLSGLLSGLLDYSRVGRMEDPSSEFELREVLEETVDSVRGAKEVDVTIDSAPIRLFAPPFALARVVQNLVNNAIHHHEGSRPQVQVAAVEEQDHVRISVVDDGPGIPEELHSRVFQIFKTVKSRDECESSGVGLAIVQKILDSVGGSISLRSSPGEGCTFTVLWPKRFAVSGSSDPRERPMTIAEHPSVHSPNADAA